MAETRDYARLALSGFMIVFTINILAAGLGYLIRLVLARNLSESGYGLFFAVMTFISLVTFFRSLGLPDTYVKYIPSFLARGRKELVRLLFAFVLKFTLLSSLLFAALLWFLSEWLATHYFGDPRVVWVLRLVLLFMVVRVFSDTARHLSQSFNRHLLFAGQYLCENALLLSGLLLAFLLFSPSPTIAAGTYLVVYSVISLVFFPIAFQFTRSAPRSEHRLPYRELFRYGFFVMLGSLGSIVILYTDTLILTGYRSLAEVGIYNAVVPTVMLLNFIGVSISQVLMPIASELWERRKERSLAALMGQIFSSTLALLLPGVLLFIFFPKEILNVLFGPGYASGAGVLTVLGVGAFFMTFFTICASALSAVGLPQKGSQALLIGALLNVVLNFVLIPSYGMLGAGLSSFVSYLLAMCLAFVSISRLIRIELRISVLGKILSSGIIFVALLYVVRSFSGGSLLIIIPGVVLSGILYLVLLWYAGVLNLQQMYRLLRARR